MAFQEALIIGIYAPVKAHVHKMKHVAELLRNAMLRDEANKILLGDLNTGFTKQSLNHEVFQSLLLENRGLKLENRRCTYRKGTKESDIDHVLVFA